jgi:hypothetical protein
MPRKPRELKPNYCYHKQLFAINFEGCEGEKAFAGADEFTVG